MLTMFGATFSVPEVRIERMLERPTISTRGSFANTSSVPLPWCTSKSITATRSMPCS
jgi:hypothetical protein